MSDLVCARTCIEVQSQGQPNVKQVWRGIESNT